MLKINNEVYLKANLHLFKIFLFFFIISFSISAYSLLANQNELKKLTR